MWNKLNFGKHIDKTLPQVMFSDPDWFFWAWKNSVFDKHAVLKSQASDIYNKATKIQIPASCGSNMEVEYYIHHPTGKFSHFDIVPEYQPKHVGSSPAFRASFIDMSVPRQIATYDKLGCKHLVSSLKHYCFGSKSARMTKDRCEQFFDEPANFI
jgi:hypothetical protein